MDSQFAELKPKPFNDQIARFGLALSLCGLLFHFSVVNVHAGSNQSERRILDQKLKAMIKNFQQNQRTNYTKDNSIDDGATPQGYFKSSWSPTMNNGNILSVRFKFDSYTSGAATASQRLMGLTILKADHSVLGIKDIFAINVDGATALNVYAAKALQDKGASSECILTLLRSPDSDVQIKPEFSLTNDGIALYYNEGLLDAAGAGAHIVNVPYHTVWRVLHPLFQKQLSQIKIHHIDSDFEFKRDSFDRDLAIIAIGSLSQIISQEPDNDLPLRLRGDWYRRIGKEDIAAAEQRAADELNKKTDESSKHKAQ